MEDAGVRVGRSALARVLNARASAARNECALDEIGTHHGAQGDRGAARA
jgi:hypothetical protein